MRSLIADHEIIPSEAAMIQLKGAFDATTIMQFHHQLHMAISSDQPSKLFVDLNQVEHMDSAGLMALISALKLTRKFNKQLFLCSLSYPVRMILELTQLDRVFEILETSAVSAPLENGHHFYSLSR